MNNYTLSQIELGSSVINQISSSAMNNGLNKILLAGPIDLAQAAVGKISPTMSFASSQIKTLLAKTGITADVITAENYLTLWLSQLSESATRTAGLKITLDNGALIPQSLSIPNGSPATLSLAVSMLSDDGLAAPVTVAANVAHTIDNTWTKELYTLGDVAIDGVSMTGIDAVELNFGVAAGSFGGKVYPTNFNVTARRPSLTFTTYDLDVIAGWGIDGKRQAGAITIALDDLPDGVVRGSSPITITVYDSIIEYQGISASPGARASASVTITPINDGTHDPIVFSGLA